MTFNQIKMTLYTLYITNIYAYKLKKSSTLLEKKKIRNEYSKLLLQKLKIEIKVINPEKVPMQGQYLLVSNYRSIIDPLIIEIATQSSSILGNWVLKKELYNSLYFGFFTKNAGTILLDRDKSKIGGLFSDIKECTYKGDSIYIFPERTKNKSNKPITEFQDEAETIAIKNRLDILPVYIKTDTSKKLLTSLKSTQLDSEIEVVFGDIISYKDLSSSLYNSFIKQFHLEV